MLSLIVASLPPWPEAPACCDRLPGMSYAVKNNFALFCSENTRALGRNGE